MATHARMVIDLGFGDAGKGTIIDFLARSTTRPTIVRFNGGAQAAHNVVTSDGRHHTFAQFGSGTFVPGAKTFLSEYMLLDPIALEQEALHLEELGCGNVFARLTVDPRAVVVTPFHKAMNRIREVARGTARHGTCGMGIGETMYGALTRPELTLRAGDLRDPAVVLHTLSRIQEWKRAEAFALLTESGHSNDVATEMAVFENTAEPSLITEAFVRVASRFTIADALILRRAPGELLFEAAQGVLLDEWHGFHPHTTWSKTNADNALAILKEIGFAGEVEKIGVVRSYMTRHGEGPFPTEDTNLAVPELHNGETGWQGRFRQGWFDTVLAKYAIEATGGIDTFAMTHLDIVPTLPSYWDREHIPISVGYRYNVNAMAESLLTNLGVLPRGGALDYNKCNTNFFQGDTEPRWEIQRYESSEAYAHAIADLLNVRLSILSRGPTAEDKLVLL